MNILSYIVKKIPFQILEDEYMKRVTESLPKEKYEGRDISEILEDVYAVSGVADALKAVLHDDIMRFFRFPSSNQERVRGAFQRTVWLLKKIQAGEKKVKTDKAVEFTSPRHG